MRIVLVCKALPFTFKGGIQTHVWELSKQLIKKGHEVTILSGGSYRAKVQTYEKDGRNIILIPYVPGRKVKLLKNTFEDLFFNIAAFFWLRKNKHNYDRIHVQGRSGCLFAAFSKSSASKVVTTFHRLLNVEYEFDGLNTSRIDGYMHQLLLGIAEREAARNSAHVIAVSQEMKRELIDNVGNDLAPLSIIPNGVNRNFGEPIVAKERWQLVFVGRLEKIKGVFTLVQALQHVDERIELLVLGDGPERRSLEQFVKEKKLRLRVKFLGNQDSESVRYWIQQSYALVLPSYHETQGIVLLEAGICGRPVIAAQVAGIDEVIEHGQNGLMFPAGNSQSLSLVIDHLFESPPLAAKLGKEGYRRAIELYDWSRIASQTEEVYELLGVPGIGERKLDDVEDNDPKHISEELMATYTKKSSLNYLS